jgi:hypothetical protein
VGLRGARRVLLGGAAPRYALSFGNLILQPDDLSVSPWAGAATVSAGGVASPNGGTCSTLSDATAASLVGRQQSVTIPAGTDIWTSSVYLKAGTSSVCSLRVSLSGGVGVAGEVVTDLSSGAQQWRTGNVGTSFAATDVGNGWWRVFCRVTNSGANTALLMDIRPAFAASYSPTADAAGTGTVFAWRAQVVIGA